MTLQVFIDGGPPPGSCWFSNFFACELESELPTLLLSKDDNADLGGILRQRDACQGPDKCTPRLSPIPMSRSLSDVERKR
jgi:hypothetical protein